METDLKAQVQAVCAKASFSGLWEAPETGFPNWAKNERRAGEDVPGRGLMGDTYN